MSSFLHYLSGVATGTVLVEFLNFPLNFIIIACMILFAAGAMDLYLHTEVEDE